jgi:hypothetical protein
MHDRVDFICICMYAVASFADGWLLAIDVIDVVPNVVFFYLSYVVAHLSLDVALAYMLCLVLLISQLPIISCSYI